MITRHGRNPFDAADGVVEDLVPKFGGLNIGSAQQPFENLYVNNVIGALEVLDNNVYLEAANAAGSGILKLIKGDASDNTVINAKTGKVISLAVNEVVKGSISVSAITYPAFNLTDGSDKNYNLAINAVGTAYSLTTTPTALTFGTTSPALTINKAGTYLLLGRVNVKYNGATFAASRVVTLKLRRTNNTAADLTNGTMTAATDIVTTKTFTFGTFELPPIVYTTANLTDAITIFGDVAVAPTAGSLDTVEASIVAIRLS